MAQTLPNHMQLNYLAHFLKGKKLKINAESILPFMEGNIEINLLNTEQKTACSIEFVFPLFI